MVGCGKSPLIPQKPRLAEGRERRDPVVFIDHAKDSANLTTVGKLFTPAAQLTIAWTPRVVRRSWWHAAVVLSDSQGPRFQPFLQRPKFFSGLTDLRSTAG